MASAWPLASAWPCFLQELSSPSPVPAVLPSSYSFLQLCVLQALPLSSGASFKPFLSPAVLPSSPSLLLLRLRPSLPFSANEAVTSCKIAAMMSADLNAAAALIVRCALAPR